MQTAAVSLFSLPEFFPTEGHRMGAVLDATGSNSRRDELVALRVRIATAIDDEKTPARDLAALTRRQIDISKEIETLDRIEQAEKIDARVPGRRSFDIGAI